MYSTLICSNCCVLVRRHWCVSTLIIISIIRCYPLIGGLCYWSAVMLCLSRDPCIRIFVSVKSSLLIVLGESRMWMLFLPIITKIQSSWIALLCLYTHSKFDWIIWLYWICWLWIPSLLNMVYTRSIKLIPDRQLSAPVCGVLIKSTEIYFHTVNS